uniref:Tc1-like transposase DDE domain-containing protein n=1 Tax=Scleropages formosus TaxID=113540 RepID=A0A8C9W1L9_SCLFO
MDHNQDLKPPALADHPPLFKVLTWPPNFPDLNPIEYLLDALEKQAQSMEAPPCNLKDLLLTSWCQIPQDTFKGLESMPSWVRAVLAERGGTYTIL